MVVVCYFCLGTVALARADLHSIHPTGHKIGCDVAYQPLYRKDQSQKRPNLSLVLICA